MPACNIEAMNLHLAEIAATVAPAAHAILLVDQAGWHLSTRLLVPANITIILLPPKCPELNPVENVWQFMRDNWLGSPTASSNPTTISSTIVVRHGTSSSTSLGASCPSDCANGPTGSDQWDLVLDALLRPAYEKIGCKSQYVDMLGAVRHCQRIRNQYAHCHY